mgnify:FL=1
MDLGGDSNRLYFYDPISFIKSISLYDVFPLGRGSIEPSYYYLPFVGFLALLKTIGFSSTQMISLINSLKLAVGFISIFLIVRALLLEAVQVRNSKITQAALLSGLFYIISFNSYHMAVFWDRAILSHMQVFLNPLIFYLLLKFFFSHSYSYLWISLLISFIFSPNFGLTSVPPFFAFYPLALVFLFIYVGVFRKKPIPWVGVCVGVVGFLFLHAFQLFGQVASLFDNSSSTNVRVFNKEQIEQGGVNYFTAVHGLAKGVYSILLPSAIRQLQWTSFAAPLIVIVGLLLNRKRKEFLLTALFFALTFFLVTANITDTGFSFYRVLFYIPGFSIFRNFYTQWLFVFIFFYALLFGFGSYTILEKLKPHGAKIFYVFALLFFVTASIPLVSGEIVTKNIIRGSNNVKSTFIVDPRLEETLQFVRTLPDDGKILSLPVTDYYLQIVSGRDGGAYEGPSMITFLTGKYSFVGYQHFGYLDTDPAPYANELMKYAKEKNYDRITRILTTLNIRYIFHNSDPKAYEDGFSPGPFGFMMTSLPKTQEEYSFFLMNLPIYLIYVNGPYKIYEIANSAYNSTIFIPGGAYQSREVSFHKDKTHDVFMSDETCSKSKYKYICEGGYKKPKADISFEMVNPTLYTGIIKTHEPVDSLMLVLQHSFHKGWKLILDQINVQEDSHIPVNGYANGWLLRDLESERTYAFTIKLEPQKYFWYGALITAVSLLALLCGLLYLLYKRIHNRN